jgi:hypothetical protein
VQFNIPQNGYKSDIKQALESGNYAEWVDAKFGARIRELISEDFTLDVQPGFFIADFLNETDAFNFIKTFGGRAVD